jgi:aminoacrylate hydrolase
MAKFETQGISLHYELLGDRGNPPVLLIAGLGGYGASWGAQIQRFAANHLVVLPDHRGTGQTTRSKDGYSIAQSATDMASLLEHLDLGPTHLVGSSAGGLIAQVMALDHPSQVRSVTLAASYARPDSYIRRAFRVRRKLMEESDLETVYTCNALFLFSPSYASRNEALIDAWIDRAAAQPPEREIALKRIDMVMAHDEASRLGGIRHPVFVLTGDQDLTTPPHLSEELAGLIPGSKLTVLPNCGHFIYQECEEKFFDLVSAFIAQH